MKIPKQQLEVVFLRNIEINWEWTNTINKAYAEIINKNLIDDNNSRSFIGKNSNNNITN